MQRSSEHNTNQTSYLTNITQNVVICSSKRHSPEKLKEQSMRKTLDTNRKNTNSQEHGVFSKSGGAMQDSKSPISNRQIPKNSSPKSLRRSSSPKLSLPEVLNSFDTDSDSDDQAGLETKKTIFDFGVPPGIFICPGFSEIPPNLLIFEDDDIYSDTSNTSGKRKRSTDDEDEWDPGKFTKSRQKSRSKRKFNKSKNEETADQTETSKINPSNSGNSKYKSVKPTNQIRTSKRVRNKPEKQNLTPLGLPKKLHPTKKLKFSTEEIYKNENFERPVVNSLETIFEEKDKESARVSHTSEKDIIPKKMGRKLHRAIYFQTDPGLRIQKKATRKKQLKKLQLYRITDQYKDHRRANTWSDVVIFENGEVGSVEKTALLKSKTRKQRRRSTDSKDKLNRSLNDLRKWEEQNNLSS